MTDASFEPFDDPDEIWDPAVLKYGPRKVAQELLRAQLEADACRGELDTARFRARLRVARHLEVPAIELQRLTGVARQTVYNATKRPIGNELEDLSVLALVAAGSAQTLSGLDEATGASPYRIKQAVSQLHAASYVDVLAHTSTRAEPVGVFSISSKGLKRLQIETDSERLRSTHSDAWTIFIAIEPSQRAYIEDVAPRLLGDNRSFGVVEATVAPSRMAGPELALIVRAPDSREALIVTNGLWTRLAQDVPELPSTPPVVAISPPTS
jgi:hypothetical protein